MQRKLYTPGRLFKRILADRNKIAIPLDGTPQDLKLKREVMLRGELFIEVVDDTTGEVVDEHRYNTLTDAFRSAVASLIVNGTLGRPTKMRLGTGSYASDMEISTSLADYNQSLTSSGSTFDRFAVNIKSTDGVARRIARVLFWMRRTGTPAGTIFAELYNAPLTTVLDTSSSVAIATIGTTYGWVSLPFSTLPVITAGVESYVAVRTSGFTSGVGNTLELAMDQNGTSRVVLTNATLGTWGGAFGSYDIIYRAIAEPDANYSNVYGLVTGGEKNFTSATNPASNQARMLSNYTTAEANEYIGHIGMFDAAGNMHAIAGVNFQKTSSQSVNVYWVVSVS